MIRKLNFEIQSRDGWHVVIDAETRDGKLFASVGNAGFNEYADGEKWLAAIEKINLDSWEDGYGLNDKEYEEDIKWSLEYINGISIPRKITGINVVPNNWDALMEALEMIAPAAELIDPHRLDAMEMSYKQRMEIPPQFSGMLAGEPMTKWDYVESITADRVESKLLYTKLMGKGCTVTQNFDIENGVAAVLDMCADYFKSHGVFESVEEDELDEEESFAPEEAVLELSLKLHNGDVIENTVTYDRHGLPDDWINLMENLGTFVMNYGGPGQLFNSAQFQHGVRDGEYVVLAVNIEGENKLTPCLAASDDYVPGEKVYVKTDGITKQGVVDHVEYFTPAKMPYAASRLPMVFR